MNDDTDNMIEDGDSDVDDDTHVLVNDIINSVIDIIDGKKTDELDSSIVNNIIVDVHDNGDNGDNGDNSDNGDKYLPRRKEKRNLVITILYVIFIIAIIITWVSTIVVDIEYDNNTINQTIYYFPYQYTWFISIPLAFFLMLFPAHAFISGLFNMICPIRFMRVNSEYYSCIPPIIPENFKYPSVTVHLPVYKEDFKSVIQPTLNSVIACREYYRGIININILISDDGIASLDKSQIEERQLFYNDNNIGYIARPQKNRAGKFKKAGNLNFSMEICRIKENYQDNNIEECLKDIQCEISCGGDLHIGDYILLIDSDSRIPFNCLSEVLVEFDNDPKLALTQHLTFPIKTTNTFWESFISHFTKMIYGYSILISSAGGNLAPFVGHNALIRKTAMYDTCKNFVPGDSFETCINRFRNCEYTYPYIWSEKNVSEDFRLFLRFIDKGYKTRYITYTGDEFLEGVSFSYSDELDKFRKYTYGAFEILFNPIKFWICCKRLPINNTILEYLRSNADFSSKINLLAYLFSYVAMSTSVFMAYLNYFLYGWYEDKLVGLVLPTGVFLQIFVLFTIWGMLSHVIVMSRYRKKFTCQTFWEDLKYIATYFLFFGSIQYHISKVVLTYLFCSDNISWGTTRKELEQINRKTAVKETFRVFADTYILFSITIVGMIIMAMPFIPTDWRIYSIESLLPLSFVSVVHLMGPILLNPYIMSYKLRYV
jgi:cellulose synthase/poly-beta-1,6-N-acetylglucosamine synthase-like glycosyltransferase